MKDERNLEMLVSIVDNFGNTRIENFYRMHFYILNFLGLVPFKSKKGVACINSIAKELDLNLSTGVIFVGGGVISN